jgi:hypothetical protein
VRSIQSEVLLMARMAQIHLCAQQQQHLHVPEHCAAALVLVLHRQDARAVADAPIHNKACTPINQQAMRMHAHLLIMVRAGCCRHMVHAVTNFPHSPPVLLVDHAKWMTM